MGDGRRDFGYLRERYDGITAFGIRVPVELRDALQHQQLRSNNDELAALEPEPPNHGFPDPAPAVEPTVAPSADAAASPILRDALDQFVDHKLTTGKWTKNIIKDMRARMTAMQLYMGEKTPVGSITLDQGREYVKRLPAMKAGFASREGGQAFIRGEQEDPSDRPPLDPTSVREYLTLARCTVLLPRGLWMDHREAPAARYADPCEKRRD